jgi:hypothetical protein
MQVLCRLPAPDVPFVPYSCRHFVHLNHVDVTNLNQQNPNLLGTTKHVLGQINSLYCIAVSEFRLFLAGLSVLVHTSDKLRQHQQNCKVFQIIQQTDKITSVA